MDSYTKILLIGVVFLFGLWVVFVSQGITIDVKTDNNTVDLVQSVENVQDRYVLYDCLRGAMTGDDVVTRDEWRGCEE